MIIRLLLYVFKKIDLIKIRFNDAYIIFSMFPVCTNSTICIIGEGKYHDEYIK